MPLGIGVPALSSASIIEPGIFGVFRPVLLLPEGIGDRLAPAELQAILAHELCHLRRRDNLAALMHMVVEAVFWFHPLVWWLGARLMDERERACDEEVLRRGSEAEAYAEGILKVCELYLQSPLKCVAGVTGANLRKRIEATADLPGMNAKGEDNQVAYRRANGAHLSSAYREQSPPTRIAGFDSGYREYRIGVCSHHFRCRRWLRDFPRGVVFHMGQDQSNRHVSQGPLPRQSNRVCIQFGIVGAPRFPESLF